MYLVPPKPFKLSFHLSAAEYLQWHKAIEKVFPKHDWEGPDATGDWLGVIESPGSALIELFLARLAMARIDITSSINRFDL